MVICLRAITTQRGTEREYNMCMNDNMTARLFTKLIELKAELDTADKKLTFKVSAANTLSVSAYPYFNGVLCMVDLNNLTEEKYNYVVNSILVEFAR